MLILMRRTRSVAAPSALGQDIQLGPPAAGGTPLASDETLNRNSPSSNPGFLNVLLAPNRRFTCAIAACSSARRRSVLSTPIPRAL